MEQRTVIVVDDHEVVRVGVVSLLSRSPGWQVVGEAATGAEALALVREKQPDLVLLDLRLPDMDGVTVCREIRQACAQTEIVVLTAFGEEELVLGTLAAGARGYLLKGASGQVLLQALETVSRGQSFLDPAVMTSLARCLVEGHSQPWAQLTQQERQLLTLVGQGKTNREIAGELYLSERTVRNQLSRLFKKLGLKNRTQAAVYATRHGFR